MGKGTGLEVLKKGTSTFVSAPGSKIQNGSYGQFFEAQNGDLYVVSQYSTLEVLKFGANTFQRARGSKINTGLFAKIFQARNGDIYTMGYNAPLQVLKKGEDKFKAALGSNIKNGRLGRFFQARNGDIYAMGDSGLEVLKGKQLEFALTHETSSGNNDGQITLTNYKNQFSKLQYRKEGSATWDDVPSKGIINSLSPGLYEFQWVAKDGFQYDESTTSIEIIHEKQLIASAQVIDIPDLPTFTLAKETTSDANDGSITVTTFANADSQLQYRQTLINDVWKDVPSSGQINDLSPGEYAFRWKSKNYQYYRGIASIVAVIEQKQMVVSADTTNIPISPTFHKTDETIKGLNDGKIIVRNLLQKYPRLRFRTKRSKNIGYFYENINPNGIIENLEIFNKKYYWFLVNPKSIYINPSKGSMYLNKDEIEHIFKPRLIDTEYDQEQNPTKYKVILKSYFEEDDHWLQYKKIDSSVSKWKNVLSSGIIDNLSPGTYQFRWKSKKMQIYEGTSQPTKLIEESFTISEGTNILVPPLPNFQVTSETTSGGNDGIITITNFTNAHSKLQYRKEGTLTWTDVPPNGIIDSLSPGVYEFQWTSKSNSELYDETSSNTYALKKQVVLSNARKTDQVKAKIATDKALFDTFNPTLDAGVNRLNNGEVTKETLEGLSGHGSLPEATAGVTRKYNINTNPSGLATVTVTFTSSGFSATANYEINNFKTIAQTNAEAKIATDKALFDTFNPTLDAGVNRLNNGEVTKETLEGLSGHGSLPEATASVTRAYNINTNPSGLATVTVTFTSSGFSATANYEINNFKTIAQTNAEAKIATDKALFDTFNPTLDAGVNRLNNGEVTKETLEGLSGHGSLPEATAGVTRAYNINTNPDGLATVTVTFTSSGFSATANYEINNFKTIAQTNAEAKIATDKALFDTFNPTLDAGLNRINNGEVTKETLESLSGHGSLPEATAGVTRTYNINTNPAGLATVTVTFTSSGFSATANYEINNFKTTTQTNAEAKIATDKALFDTFNPTLDAGVNRLNNGEVTKETLEGLSGHGSLPEATAGVTRTYNINTNPAGLATVTVTFTSSGFSATANYEINNFKTIAQTNAEAKIATDKALFDTFNPTLDAGVNRINNGEVTKETLESLSGHGSLPEATAGVTRTYNINTNPAGLATVTVTFTSSGFSATANYEINNFKTTAQTNAEGAIAKDKTVLSNFGNQNVMGKPDSLANGVANKETLENLNGHKKIPKAIANVNRAYRINTNLITGIATVTIDLTSGESPNQVFATFTYTISGFKTQAQINATTLETAVQALDVNGLSGKGDSSKLPSEISEANALSWIKALSSINGLADDVKNLLGEDDITLAFNDEEGILEITINNHGAPKTFRQISGFRVQTNSEALALVVQALDVNSFNGKGDSSKLPSEIKKATVLSWIKELSIINDLAKFVKDVKDLLLEDNIMLSSNDQEGSLVITINSHGDPKTFSKILGFKTNAKKAIEDVVNTDKALFSDFDQTLTRRIEPLEDGVVIDLTPLTSNGHQAMPPQTSGVTREFKIARAATGIATMTVTFKAGASLNQVSDTITYKINGFKVITFQGFNSSLAYSALAKNLKTVTSEILEKDVKTEFEKINDYATYNNVDATVKLLKVEVVASDETQRQVTYKLTYTVSGGIEKQKDIAITFALDLDADAKKFKDFISSAQHSELKSTINVASGDTPPNVQADFIKIPGYARPANLSADVLIKSVIVKTPYNASTRQVVYMVTITNGKEDKSFDLTVTFKPDFALERVKFKNFNSNLGTYSEIAIAPKSGNDVKALFEKIDGYVIPQNLATGVKIHRVVVNVALNIVTRQVIYSIRLWDGKNIDTNEYGIVVTFAKDLDAGAHQLSNFTSSDNVKSLAALLPQNDSNVKTTFEAISGFARPQLSKNVKIAKVVVKKALDAITRKVTFTITLAKTNQNDASATSTIKAKDVIVTFAPSLDEEAKKFQDFVSSDNVKSKAALLKQNNDDIKTTFEAISGFAKPILTSGVQMSKAIVKKALSDSRVIFTITLTYEGDRKTKDITVTFKKVSIAKSETLSTGAIVGIAIGSIASLGILGYLIYYLMKRK